MSTSLVSYLAIASDYRPSSIADCCSANGELDLFKFLSHQEKCSDLARAEKNFVALLIPDKEEASETSETSSKRTRRRHAKALTPCCFNDDGMLEATGNCVVASACAEPACGRQKVQQKI